MSNRQWREGYDEGLHQVHLELDPKIDELEAEVARLRTSVMESDGRWKDLSARYDALFAHLRTAEEENERLGGDKDRMKAERDSHLTFHADISILNEALEVQLREAREENEQLHRAQDIRVKTVRSLNAQLRTARGALELADRYFARDGHSYNDIRKVAGEVAGALRDMGDVPEGRNDDRDEADVLRGDDNRCVSGGTVDGTPVADCPVCEGCGKPVASGDGHCLWEDGKRTCPTCQRNRLDAACPDERSGYDDADGWSARSADYERGFSDGCEAPCPGCAAARKRLAQIADQVEMEPIRTSGYNYQRIDALEAKINELTALRRRAESGEPDATEDK